jgi:hypothetical protein
MEDREERGDFIAHQTAGGRIRLGKGCNWGVEPGDGKEIERREA